ncbi:MAG: hypothetical protein Q8O56_11970 [Solirubrobacteraceae bacterium]|nr:hypothetical protein [Solirubrobacteraceae bacterium]
METTRSEKAPGEKVICLYPGCEQEAVEPPRKDNRAARQGPPPRYCENEEHNAASTFQEIKRLEQEGAAS